MAYGSNGNKKLANDLVAKKVVKFKTLDELLKQGCVIGQDFMDTKALILNTGDGRSADYNLDAIQHLFGTIVHTVKVNPYHPDFLQLEECPDYNFWAPMMKVYAMKVGYGKY